MTDIDKAWAFSRVEAMADGSLGAAEKRRMRAAMDADPRLREAVARAERLRQELSRLARVPVPPSLRRRLLGIAKSSAPSSARRGRWAATAVLGATAAVAIVSLWLPRHTPRSAERQVEAVKNFQIAMIYLHRSAAVADEKVAAAVNDGLRDAFDAGREAARADKQQSSKGD